MPNDSEHKEAICRRFRLICCAFKYETIRGGYAHAHAHTRLLWVDLSCCFSLVFVLAPTRIMEAETKLHDFESAGRKTVTIIPIPVSERKSSFDRDERPLLRTRTASNVSRGAEEIERRYKMCLRAETVGLAVVIVVVWGLLLLPVVFYHLPDNIIAAHAVSTICVLFYGIYAPPCSVLHFQ